MLDKNRLNRMVRVVLVATVLVFAVVLTLQLASLLYTPAKGACNVQVCLKKFLDGPPAYNDGHMARFLQNKYLSPPGAGERRLANNNNGKDIPYQTSVEFLLEHFKDKRDGRFVVLGAGDGEYLDVTLPLETQLGWTGLLIEPLPELHSLLKAKNRRAELSNACVSPFAYPTQMKLSYPAFKDVTDPHQQLLRYRETRLSQLWTENFVMSSVTVQCIPVANLIYASNIIKDKIDLLVMDMAGTDLDLLLTTNLDWLPPVDMIMVVSHGTDLSDDVSGYFMEKNMVISKVFGTDTKNARYIVSKFYADESLVD